MSTALVTGGAGFIGSHVTERLLREGWRTVVLDDFNTFYDPALKRANAAAYASNPNARVIEGDILDEALVARLFADERPEVVVHLAARAGVRPSIAEPKLYEAVNVRGTLNLLEEARKSGVRKFIFGSSSSVYGINSKLPFSEDDPIRTPISPYAATKAAGEQLCYAFQHLYRLPVVCLRFFTVYGPRQRPDLAIRKFVERIGRDEEIPFFGDGSTRRDYTHVDDIVDGVQAAIGYDRARYAVFNLGNSNPVTLSELVANIEEAVGKKATLRRLPDQPGDVPVTYADVSRAKAELGFEPRVPLREGLRRFVEWHRSHAGVPA